MSETKGESTRKKSLHPNNKKLSSKNNLASPVKPRKFQLKEILLKKNLEENSELGGLKLRKKPALI